MKYPRENNPLYRALAHTHIKNKSAWNKAQTIPLQDELYDLYNDSH